ncbi:DUF6470 family protein [Priestia taiwanensis]|uniref:YviE n=1 Tax=Priestia taiwanensis TaxID=1347902 RepID=A0A917EUD1_9BACI|nr:DUF6470 family protein [Priestia taiwanensis]MBM7364379.1 hypothetical protein [Priestia taiwanensis]GGE84915.1 hypothetical protein GCM10007140_38040 [Priestia taiwanensis]
MNLSQIRIQSTPIQHRINIEKPVQDIQQPKAELQIEQAKSKLNIETEKSELTIDSQQARDEIDLKSIRTRIEEHAQLGYKAWLDAIGKMSSQGDELMRIENRGNVIAAQAEENGSAPIYDTNIAFIPSYGSVKINYKPAKVNISFDTTPANIQVKLNKPILNYTPGKVTGSIERWNSLQIDYTGVTIDVTK